MTSTTRHIPEAGVSLIEVMAALAIVALMGAIAVVMLDARRTALDISADRLTRALAEARQEALLSGRVIGFSAAPDLRGWAFHHYRDGRWRAALYHRVAPIDLVWVWPFEPAPDPDADPDAEPDPRPAAPSPGVETAGPEQPGAGPEEG